MSDGKLSYEIDASAKGFTAAIQSAMTSVGGLSMSIAKVATGAGLLGAGAGAAAGIGFGIKAAADREQVEVAMKNIIGDVGKAKAVMKELATFTKNTPMEFNDVLDASRKLLSAGVATNDLIGELTALGNVAAAVGTDVGGLATIYTQIADKGKVYAEELMQFGERGAGAIKTALAESLGVSKTELIEMVTAGKVSFEQFKVALQKLAGEGGKWGNTMAEQATTTVGLFSNLKGAINEVMLTLGQPINDAIKPILSDATALAEDLKPIATEIGTAIAGIVTGLRDLANGATLAEVGKKLEESFGVAFARAGVMIGAFGKALGDSVLVAMSALKSVLEPLIMGIGAKLESSIFAAMAALMEGVSELPGMGGADGVAGQKAQQYQFKSMQGSMASKALLGDMLQNGMEVAGKKLAWGAANAMQLVKAGLFADTKQNYKDGVKSDSEIYGYNPYADLQEKPADQALPAETSDEPYHPYKTAQKKPSTTGAPERSASVAPAAPPMIPNAPAIGGGMDDGSRREDLRSEDMAAAGGGSASGGSGRRKISGANAEKRANWKQREWQRMGAGGRKYFSSSMYGSRTPDWAVGAMENRTNDAMGRGRGSSGGRERRNTTDAASTQAATSTNLLNAVLQEIRKMNQHLSGLKSS